VAPVIDRASSESQRGRPTAAECRAVIDHLGVEVSDLARSAAFYDAVFFAIGVRRVHEGRQAIAYGVNAPTFWITARGRRPAAGYGHVALRARGRVAVDGAHAAGLRHGGRDDGAPGIRERYGPLYYAAYLLDPDGLRVEVVSGSG
jgi:catechol 2,3-dioxygenase-like lactoylglutathione lyase family enzyme